MDRALLNGPPDINIHKAGYMAWQATGGGISTSDGNGGALRVVKSVTIAEMVRVCLANLFHQDNCIWWWMCHITSSFASMK